MLNCPNCGASNSSSARFCADCGVALGEAPAAKYDTATDSRDDTVFASAPDIDMDHMSRSLSKVAEKLEHGRRADVLFVLDCTGSMQGEIDAIKDTIIDFSDTIRSHGVRVRVGLIGFRDRLIKEEPEVLKFGGEVFTDDSAAFRKAVSRLHASGGGDIPESSLDAVMLAVRQPFLPGVSRVIVLITDAPPHIPDKDTRSIDEVVRAITDYHIDQLYIVMRTDDAASRPYLKLMSAARGMAFDLGKGDDFRRRSESFKRTLMSLGKTISVGTR